MPAIPKWSARMGQLPDGAVTLIETVADAEAFTPRDPSNLAYVTQTTLSVDDTAEIVAALKRRFPAIVGPHKEDICYATTNRQEAVKRVAPQVDAHDRGRRAELVELAAPAGSRRARRLPLLACWCSAPPRSTGRCSSDIAALGITAGASAPEVLVEEIIDAFAERYDGRASRPCPAPTEDMFFPLPRPLRDIAAA